jgi:type I restriction enzyme R subunit
VLDYFSAATQVGLTATPKETTDVSTTHYFGEDRRSSCSHPFVGG